MISTTILKKMKEIIVLVVLFTAPLILAQEKELSFKKGEKLTYKVHYGLVAAGTAELVVKTRGDEYKFIAKGRSTGVFNLLFKVRNTYESYVSRSSLKPNQFYRRR